MTAVADIANLIRDGRIDAAMAMQLSNGYPLYLAIEKLVRQVVTLEEAKTAALRRSVDAANRQALDLLPGFLGASMGLALLLGFVISWSFIVPGARRIACWARWRPATSARPSTCRTATSSVSWPPA